MEEDITCNECGAEYYIEHGEKSGHSFCPFCGEEYLELDEDLDENLWDEE